ncbi:hypothetical protein BBJ29_008468 [Phytophthora kernoviae]|uniref:RWP-RK domain-containing protein n=1 Tax=Phytophthora kernoviae TaxID=325452 RepID=A0A3F2RIJ9_9STRA|nr:hypothetical protein BBJ29_008468 [Phytophthora kernoviae]RLN56375.1 hypothetical protein BBP00_00008034 [Phytophthora kernoviae]
MATARRTATKRMARGLQTAPKTPRKSRRKYDFKPNLLEQYFHMPQKEAALLLGVAVITVKRNCKRYKIEWPYRANKYKYKARNQVPLSEKGLAFMKLPLDCINEETEGDIQVEVEGPLYGSVVKPLWYSLVKGKLY